MVNRMMHARNSYDGDHNGTRGSAPMTTFCRLIFSPFLASHKTIHVGVKRTTQKRWTRLMMLISKPPTVPYS